MSSSSLRPFLLISMLLLLAVNFKPSSTSPCKFIFDHIDELKSLLQGNLGIVKLKEFWGNEAEEKIEEIGLIRAKIKKYLVNQDGKEFKEIRAMLEALKFWTGKVEFWRRELERAKEQPEAVNSDKHKKLYILHAGLNEAIRRIQLELLMRQTFVSYSTLGQQIKADQKELEQFAISDIVEKERKSLTKYWLDLVRKTIKGVGGLPNGCQGNFDWIQETLADTELLEKIEVPAMHFDNYLPEEFVKTLNTLKTKSQLERSQLIGDMARVKSRTMGKNVKGFHEVEVDGTEGSELQMAIKWQKVFEEAANEINRTVDSVKKQYTKLFNYNRVLVMLYQNLGQIAVKQEKPESELVLLAEIDFLWREMPDEFAPETDFLLREVPIALVAGPKLAKLGLEQRMEVEAGNLRVVLENLRHFHVEWLEAEREINNKGYKYKKIQQEMKQIALKGDNLFKTYVRKVKKQRELERDEQVPVPEASGSGHKKEEEGGDQRDAAGSSKSHGRE